MKLIDLASVIRSKNAGPTQITLDILFNDGEAFEQAKTSANLQPPANWLQAYRQT